MRNPLTLLVILVVVVLAVVFVIRSGSQEAVPEAATTTGAPASTAAPTTTAEPAASTSTTLRRLPDGEVCELYSTINVSGSVENPDLVEASGLAMSRQSPGVLWSHNDSRGGPFLYAFDTTGSDLGAFEVPDAFSLDWEDIGAGPGPDGEQSYLYVGDMGDNFGIRDGVITVWRVPDNDPSAMTGAFPESDAIVLKMPDGPHDAEALFVDPVEPAIYVVTKSRSEAFVFKGPMTSGSEPAAMELATTLFLDAEVSGADITADGSVIALRGYQTVWLWGRQQGQSIAEALGSEPCLAPSPEERQGESIAFDPTWSYLTVSEGEHPDIHIVPSGE
ncbi:MAG: hypothetical protein ACR2N7_02165 [Acidimicrobiia bacterium]